MKSFLDWVGVIALGLVFGFLLSWGLTGKAFAQTVVVTQPAPAPTCTVRGNVVYCF